MYDYDRRRPRLANASEPMVSVMRAAFMAGQKSNDSPEEAGRGAKAAEHELMASAKQLTDYQHHPTSMLGPPIGIFANIASAAWELAYYKGAEAGAATPK